MGNGSDKILSDMIPETDISRVKILDEFSSEIHKYLRLEEVMRSAVNGILHIFGEISAIEIHLFDEDKGTLYLKSQRGFSPEFVGAGTLSEGEGLAGTVAATREPYFVGMLAGDEKADARLVKKESLSSYGGVPLQFNKKIVGTLGLYTKIPRTFTKHEQILLAELGRRIGIAIHNAVTYEQASVRARRFITISRAITVTRQLGTLNEVLQDITKVLVQSLGFDQSWIGLIDEDARLLIGKVGFGSGMNSADVSTSYAIDPKSKNPSVQAILEQKPIVLQFVKDVKDASMRAWLTKQKVQSFGYIPILSGERTLGVIGVFYLMDQAFEEEDVKTLVSVAEQAAIAIENAQLYEKIKTSEVQYRTLFESAGTSLVIVDEKQQFQLVNHAFETMSGYNRDDLIGKMTLPSFLKDERRSKKKSADWLRHPPQTWETRFCDRNGVSKEVYLTTTNLPGTADILVSLIDMTRERELERRLFRSEQLASIGELSAGIAHEIRNPLVAITTSVSLLKDEPMISDEGRQLLDVVKEESDHLAHIVDDFLRYARPKRPKFNDEDINQLLSDVIKRNRDWNENAVNWIEKYQDSLPLVSLDRHQIQQVVTNLLRNGMDAMTDGGTLKIETSKDDRLAVPCVRLSITDTGEGISKDEIDMIFQPFYSTKDKGTGMGLAICRRIVNDHGGEIFVDSKVKQGTCFSIVLPQCRENEED